MFTTSLKTQTPARLKALKFSIGITATASDAAKAHHFAQSIVKIRPGVLTVGRCIVDLWRMSCSCSAMRARKMSGIAPTVKPCPHFLAAYLAMEWTPADNDPTLYLRRMGIEQPKILAVYATLRGIPGTYRLGASQYGDGRRSVDAVSKNADPILRDIPISSIKSVFPFYE